MNIRDFSSILYQQPWLSGSAFTTLYIYRAMYSEKSRAFGQLLSTTLYIARQHYTFIEQCIVKSRERLATLSRQHYTLLDNTIHLSSNV